MMRHMLRILQQIFFLFLSYISVTAFRYTLGDSSDSLNLNHVDCEEGSPIGLLSPGGINDGDTHEPALQSATFIHGCT